MVGKYVIIDLRSIDHVKDQMVYMTDQNGKIILCNTEIDAAITCEMLGFKNVWICKLIFNYVNI